MILLRTYFKKDKESGAAPLSIPIIPSINTRELLHLFLQ